MAIDFKKVVLIVGLSIIVVTVVSSVLYVFAVRWERQTNDRRIEPERLSNPTLKYVAVLFRHGNRAPMFKYNTDPHKNAFPEGKYELTKKGKQNMYKKGQIFRRLYNGFLSDLYLDSEILIKTTNKSRTFMTAAMVLAGMYPPKDYQKWSDSETVWQPIPIYYNSPDHGTLFDERGKCPAFDSMANKLYIQLNNHSTDTNITTLMSYLSENCGQPINFKNLIKLYDLFICQRAEGLPLPEWIKPYHIEEIKSIIMNKKTTELYYENRRFQKIIIGPLLNEIGLNMESHLNNNDTRKMHLYSGHDHSVAMAMSFLGNTIELPNFGASIHFHLYHSEMDNEHTIKVYFYDRWDNENGKEVLIPICGDPCKFKDFKNILDNNLSGEWAEDCQQLES